VCVSEGSRVLVHVRVALTHMFRVSSPGAAVQTQSHRITTKVEQCTGAPRAEREEREGEERERERGGDQVSFLFPLFRWIKERVWDRCIHLRPS